MTIDGQEVDDADVRVIEGRVFIYARLLERLGYAVAWNAVEGSVEVTGRARVVRRILGRSEDDSIMIWKLDGVTDRRKDERCRESG